MQTGLSCGGGGGWLGIMEKIGRIIEAGPSPPLCRGRGLGMSKVKWVVIITQLVVELGLKLFSPFLNVNFFVISGSIQIYTLLLKFFPRGDISDVYPFS